MIRILLLTTMTILLTTCAAQTMWIHPTANQEQFEKDRYECIKDGEQHAANQGFGGNPFIVAQRAKECMRIKGYSERPIQK